MKQNFMIGSLDNMNDIMQICSDGTPCIMISGEQDR